MTNKPEGRDRSASVAALAVQVDKLRRDVQSLTVKVDTLAGTQQAQAASLAGIAELRAHVDRILATLTSENEDQQATWCWLTMTDQDREDKLAELTDWVETVLRAQYPGYLADHLKSCWPNHPEARWELAWLYQLWTVAYLTNRRDSSNAADWHDRWLPGVIRRLSSAMVRCKGNCDQ